MSDESPKPRPIEANGIRCQPWADLQDVIPLPAPYALYIEPTNVCNLKCTFCPTGDSQLLKSVGRPKGFMLMDLFRKIVQDIKEFAAPLRVVHFYKDGEPLLARPFPGMVR